MLELIITMAVLGIITAIAGPNMSQFLERRNLSQQSTMIADAFSLARSTALTNGKQSTVCWNTGGPLTSWAEANEIVVLEETGTGITDPVVIQRVSLQTLLTDGYRINVARVGTTSECVFYDAQGRPQSGVTFGVCRVDGDINELRTVVIPNSGRPTILRSNPQNFTCV